MPQERPTYWQLVEQLMRFGWYREGCDRDRDPSGRSWRFREGHTFDYRSGELWIIAPDEQTAMGILLAELQRADAERRGRSGCEEG